MDLQSQLDYHIWAETQFINLLKDITEDNFLKVHSKAEKSLVDIYAHKVEVMWFWFQLMRGIEPYDAPKFSEMTPTDLFSCMDSLFQEIRSFLKKEKDLALELELPWLNKKYPVTRFELIYNILNHHTYHRGQLAIIFKELGLNTPETDYNSYLFSKLQLV